MTIQHSRQPEPDPSDPTAAVSAPDISIDRAGDSLALVRYTFGRLPADSLVLIGLQGGTTGGHLRLDFSAALKNPRHCAERAADWLAGPEADPVPDAVLAAVFTDAWPAQRQHQGSSLISQLEHILQIRHRCPLIKTWYIGGGYVRDFDCTDPRCCPYPGLAAEDEIAAALTRSPQLDRLNPVSAPDHTIQTFLGVPPGPDAPTAEMIRSARQRTRNTHSGDLALDLWEISLKEITTTGHCTSALNPGHIAALLRSAEEPLLVQAMAPLAAVGIETARLGCRISALTEETTSPNESRGKAYEDYAAALTGSTEAPPAWDRIEALDALLHLLMPYQGSHRPNLLALKGWIEWVKGSGSSATLAVDTCLGEQPDHVLAQFLAELFEAIGPCPWARVKQHSHGWWYSRRS